VDAAPPAAPGWTTATVAQEATVLRLLFEHGALRTEGMLIDESLFTDAAHRYLFQVWRGSPDLSRVPDLLDATMAARLAEVLQTRTPPYDTATAARALADVVGRMRLHRMEERKRLLAASLFAAESEANAPAVAELARAALAERTALPDAGPDAEAARQAIADLDAGVSFHRLEMALRRGATANDEIHKMHPDDG
jgi:hypothetical protein